MAGPVLRPTREVFLGQSNDPVALRFIEAESPQDVFRVLLDAIVFLGFPGAALLEADLETKEVKASASVNCDSRFLERLRTSLESRYDPFVSALLNLKPALISDGTIRNTKFYACPVIYRSQAPCREAEQERRGDCLAALNAEPEQKLRTQQQMCAACGIRSYLGLVVGQVGRNLTRASLREFQELTERANTQASRLFKMAHYYSRIREMEETMARMATVMESMADPVILTDNQHIVTMQNRAAERFLRAPEGVSRSGRRAVEQNGQAFSDALSSMATSPRGHLRDLTLSDVIDGKKLLFEAISAPTYANQTRTGTVTVMRDVTELRRADQELRANLEKLRSTEEIVRQDRDWLNAVIENVGDPIVVGDRGASIVLLDPLAKNLLGPPGALRDPRLVSNETKIKAYLSSFTCSLLDHQNKTLLLHNPDSGAEVEYAARSGKIYDARGRVAYTVTVLRDFSAWKKLEQLQMERRMLEMEKFAATGRLAGTIAHEINNPMEAIKNAIYLLKSRVEPEAQPIYEALKSETDRVTRIVRQMLGLYRNAGQLGTFDLNGIVEDTLALFARPLDRTGALVKKRLGELPGMKGSADQFRQLLSNLVVNAQDSMPNGGRLTIRTRYTKSTRGLYGEVSIVVADTGSGIPKEIRNRMFDPFVSSKGERGTGLGLWIVQGIVESHGGRIQVRSSDGRGTVFKLIFPVSGARAGS